MGRPKILCDYTFIPCRRHATVRLTLERKEQTVHSQYCDEHLAVMLPQKPRSWKITERVTL